MCSSSIVILSLGLPLKIGIGDNLVPSATIGRITVTRTLPWPWVLLFGVFEKKLQLSWFLSYLKISEFLPYLLFEKVF